MGMDFTALLKYPGPDDLVLRALDYLEAESPEELTVLYRQLDVWGYGSSGQDPARWVYRSRPEFIDERIGHRPALPDTTVWLSLPEWFFLTFGRDTIEVYHLLRWCIFLREPHLHRPMLDAVGRLAQLFGATDCLITSDFSPVVQAFHEGKSFDDAVAVAGPEDGIRPSLGDLYLQDPQPYILRDADGPGGVRTQEKEWGLDQSVPDGWERAATWDSKGYWRLPLDPRPAPPLPPVRRLGATALIG